MSDLEQEYYDQTNRRLKMVLHLQGVRYPCYIDSWKVEWAFYPRQGSELNFGGEDSSMYGKWIVTNTKMVFGAIDQIEVWAERVID